MLSLNDTPEVRAIFGSFEIEAVRTTYSMPRGAGKAAGEVLITWLRVG